MGPPDSALARTCELSMHLDAPVELGALQLELDYSGASGAFAMMGDDLDCEGDVEDALAMFGHDAETSHVTVSVLSLVGFRGPAKIGHCRYVDPVDETSNSDFSLYVSDATDLDGASLGSPRVSLAYGPCDDWPSTTSSSSTTTFTTTSTTTATLDLCGNDLVDGAEECDDGNLEDGDGCGADCTSGVVCGDANGNQVVQSTDALLVLHAAVGSAVACPLYVCDADGDATLHASDSRRVLRRAVGQSVTMQCPLD